jgi:predicted nucleic-acid-binding Zn-ribbon protein
MRTTSKCPKCDCRKLLVIDKVRQPSHHYSNDILEVHLTCLPCPSAKLGLEGHNDKRAAVGTFEAWVCTSCGYTEWYAKQFQQALWQYLQEHQTDVRLVDGDAR